MFRPLLVPLRSAIAVIAGAAFVAFYVCAAAQAADIRHFSLRTKETLGRQLYEQTRRRAAPLTAMQQRAKRAAAGALPKLHERYRFVVLADPDGSGNLVYALDTNPNPNNIVVSIHFRVTVA